MTIASPERIRAFQERVLSFYATAGRDLPWRRTTDPYHILLSEVMLQQTQVDRVKAYYQRWITEWPTVQDVARADRPAVLRQWLGLGYNRRAVYLHKTAQTIAEEFGGDVLRALAHAKALLGIGPYTARAVRIFATNADEATVDTNIRRILMHEFGLPSGVSDTEVWRLAEACVPRGRSREWHNALMDYGATVLTSRKTGIAPKTRQSRFEGSDRQIRARVVSCLLAYSSPVSVEDVCRAVKADEARLKRIVDGLVRDELIESVEGRYRVKSSVNK